MKIDKREITIREVAKGYESDDATGKVSTMDGKLDIRPEYQREFIYKPEQRDAVIHTVINDFPLNIMYFVQHDDGTAEVLDGQQRLISICEYIANNFAVGIPSKTGKPNYNNFLTLDKDLQKQILDYKLTVYYCEGTEVEKMDWFKIINVAGIELTEQEIRNALYHSPWLTDAKSLFSKNAGGFVKKYSKYMAKNMSAIRQDYLEKVFKWKAIEEEIDNPDIIAGYMQKHKADKDANELWTYVKQMFTWVEKTFGKYDKSMQGVDWGRLYGEHKDDSLDPRDVQKQVQTLLADSEVKNKSTIYEYILTGEEKYLNLRTFDDYLKKTLYERKNHICDGCHKIIPTIKDAHADHIIPWSKGGKTIESNCQILCVDCNLKKGNKNIAIDLATDN